MPQISPQPLDTSNDPNHAESHPETATATFDAIPEGQVLNDSPGKIFVEDVGTSYVDAAHWRAILEDVCLPLVKSFLGLKFLTQLLLDQGSKGIFSR
jgi:hypothetical protein